MTFAWVLGTPSGKRLAKGMGPCNGRPSSLRSEAAAMLAVSLFIGMIQEFTNFAFTNIQVTFAADNLSLIRRHNDHLEYTCCYPNTTLASEFDLTEQTYQTHRKYNIEATFVHVKGHQDSTQEVHSLSLLAQMNVEADHLAGMYYAKGPLSRNNVDLLPSCPAMLNINGASITSDYKNQLIRGYVEPHYMEHLQIKFGWSNATIQIISWGALSCSLRRINRPCLTTKICNDLLPVATRLSQWQLQSNSECCLCGAPETSSHMFLCNDPSRIRWRIKFIKAIRDRLQQLKTDPGLLDVFCSCVSDWFEDKKVSCDKYDSRYHPAIITQNNIGWFHIFTGHITQEWEKLQDQFSQSHKIQNAITWSTTLVEVCLRFSIHLWEQRNQDAHGNNAKDKKRILLDKLRVEILHLKGLSRQIRTSDAFLFSGIDDMLQEDNTTTMENWILSRKPAIYHSILQAKRQASSDTHRLYHWFKPMTAPKSPTKQLQRWTQNRLVFDPFSKKKRHKRDRMSQQRLTKFLSPCKLF